MDERHDIVLRPAEDLAPGAAPPPDLLRDLVRAVDSLFTPAADGAGKWLQGKGEAELAKAAEIKAQVLTKIASIDHERQKLIQEREAAIEGRRAEDERDRRAHVRQMYELRTKRILDVVGSLVKLRELGVEVEMKAIAGILTKALREEIRQGTS